MQLYHLALLQVQGKRSRDRSRGRGDNVRDVLRVECMLDQPVKVRGQDHPDQTAADKLRKGAVGCGGNLQSLLSLLGSRLEVAPQQSDALLWI